MTGTADGNRHFEPFVHLVDVTDHAVLIGWGGFYLERGPSGWTVVDDDDLKPGVRRNGGTIGVRSAAYGAAEVEVLDGDGRVVARAAGGERNHAWVEGLEPDTEYRYRVTVDGQDWVGTDRWDWVVDGDGDGGAPDAGAGRPRPARRDYDLRFRTHPDAETAVPVTFLAVGDYGVGIVNGDAGRRQQAVARTMEHLAANHPVRFVVSLGDNIYHGPEDQLAQSGDEDDDWYFTFYQPYRYLIDHLPLYPTAGNHDGADEEANDDRAQLADNFHLEDRFEPREHKGRASLDPGLFYRLSIGRLLEVICVDTTWGESEGHHFFDDERHRPWLEEAFPEVPAGGDGRWRIPFNHHPPYCAGPHHEGMVEQVRSLLPLYRRAGVRLVLSGHEHNFQHGRVDGIDFVVSGAGGKLDEDRPGAFDVAGTVAWAAAAHCLLVEVDEDRVVVTPYGVARPGGEPAPLRASTPAGDEVDARFVIER